MSDREIQTECGEKIYLSRTKHQKNGAGDFSKWESQDLEIETFNKADCNNWKSNQDLWGFLKDENILTIGTKKQQFGFFPATQNATDHWHGYPVFPFKEKNKKYDISKELLDLWVKTNKLTSDEISILVNGKLL